MSASQVTEQPLPLHISENEDMIQPPSEKTVLSQIALRKWLMFNVLFLIKNQFF